MYRRKNPNTAIVYSDLPPAKIFLDFLKKVLDFCAPLCYHLTVVSERYSNPPGGAPLVKSIAKFNDRADTDTQVIQHKPAGAQLTR